MANCELFYTVVDAKGDKSRLTFPCVVPTLDDAALVVVALGELIDPLINGGLVDAGFTLKVDTSTFNGVPDAIADVQEGARFVWSSLAGYLKSVRVPTAIETIFNAGSKSVDLDNTDVFAFSAAITDGIDLSGLGSVGLATFDTVHWEDLVNLESATEDWGRNR